MLSKSLYYKNIIRRNTFIYNPNFMCSLTPKSKIEKDEIIYYYIETYENSEIDNKLRKYYKIKPKSYKNNNIEDCKSIIEDGKSNIEDSKSNIEDCKSYKDKFFNPFLL